MIDSDVFRRSTVDYEQFLAYQKDNKNDLIDIIKAETVNVQFEIESTFSLESITIDTSIELVKFHVIKTDMSFLLNLADMNRLKVYFNIVENILFMITKNRNLSIIRRFDHDFLLWKNSYFLHSYIAQSFNSYFCYLTDIELRQLHRRFDHSSITKLHDLLKRSDHEVKKAVLAKLTKFCSFCQKYAKSLERFKFILKDDANCNFNYSIIVDVMYIDNNLILHVVDDVTRFQIVKWLQNISAKHTWEMLRLCWIDVYLSLSDHILIDADKNFASRKFRQFVISMTIIIKAVLVEAHWSIDVVKRYHAELRRAYQIIFENLEPTISKEIALQMIVKAINDTIDSDELMLILLVFETYSRMHDMNSPASSITQRAMTIEKAMTEIRKIRAEHQMTDVLNIRNGSIVTSIHDLSLNSDVLVWREGKKWTESYKLLDIEDETCKIVLSSESIDFRSTVIKSFLIESISEVESINEDVQSSDDQNNMSAEFPEITRSLAITRPIRARRLSLRYQNFVDIIVFLLNDDSHSN
jgi:thiol-disulfide isomerase/thioredoxin